MQSALRAVRSARGSKKSSSADRPLDWREAVGGILVGFFMLYLMLIQWGWPSWGSTQPSKVQVEAPRPDHRIVHLADKEMTPVLDGVEVHGELTNDSTHKLLRAEIVTTFHDPEGALAGTATGSVQLVEPGQTVAYATSGKLRSTSTKREGWKWVSSSRNVAWSP